MVVDRQPLVGLHESTGNQKVAGCIPMAPENWARMCSTEIPMAQDGAKEAVVRVQGRKSSMLGWTKIPTADATR